MPIDSVSACKFCQSSQQIKFSATERMLGLGGSFRYSECLSCGSLQLDDLPEDFSIYYPTAYYSFSALQPSNFVKNLFKKVRMRFFLTTGIKKTAPIFGYWLRKLNPFFSDTIADVGCGNGQLLYELNVSGFQNLHGFDPFIEKTSQVTPGLKLWKQKLENSDLRFDFIMLHHSFEHMEDPVAVLKACYEHLNPGGKLLIRCPVADSEVWKEKRAFWVQLDAPRHLIIPSVKGFEKVATRVGFRLDEVEFDSSDFQFWGTTLYENGEKLDLSKVANYVSGDQKKFFQEKALRYNREGKGDQVCFYLSKGN
jgi:SAM-dependent methyltransferase